MKAIKNFLPFQHLTIHESYHIFINITFLSGPRHKMLLPRIVNSFYIFLGHLKCFNNILNSFCDVNYALITEYLDPRSVNTFSNKINNGLQVHYNQMAT